MTSQKFPFQKGMSHRSSIFTPWNRKESLFMPGNIFCAKSYTPPSPSAFPWFASKTKIHMFNFSKGLKTAAATPWVVNFAKILPKDRVVLELWSII